MMINTEDSKAKTDRFAWSLLPHAALASALVALFLILSPLNVTNLGFFLYCLFLVPVSSLGYLWIIAWTFFNRARWKKSLSLAFLPLVFWLVAIPFGLASDRLSEDERWLLHAKKLKAQVLASPVKMNGELQHMEWDAWGFAGIGDTVSYLVFDPADALAPASHSHAPARVKGIPCEMPAVRKLQNQWYVVTFYTDWDWEHCG